MSLRRCTCTGRRVRAPQRSTRELALQQVDHSNAAAEQAGALARGHAPGRGRGRCGTHRSWRSPPGSAVRACHGGTAQRRFHSACDAGLQGLRRLHTCRPHATCHAIDVSGCRHARSAAPAPHRRVTHLGDGAVQVLVCVQLHEVRDLDADLLRQHLERRDGDVRVQRVEVLHGAAGGGVSEGGATRGAGESASRAPLRPRHAPFGRSA